MKPIQFSNTYVNLGEDFYQAIKPTPVKAPGLIAYNNELASSLGLPELEQLAVDAASAFSGNSLLEGSQPLAMAYTGHQFGHFNPGLGDGRAILLGQVQSPQGQQYDIQLKGSGPTRYSRNGDGRSALGPVIREYLVSEAMQRLGVPTTRALAAVTTGEQVARERLVPGGIITRVATSFVRVGTFQYFVHNENPDGLRALADYVIRHNYPELRDDEQPYVALLRTVVARQAKLIAQWMQLGFIHGVMNTDNMSVAAETIDYGPCAFMDQYAHDKVYSSIDHHGRYAYNNQPNIGLWNLSRFAETLLPLIDSDSDKAVEIAKQCLEGYIAHYQQAWLDGMRSKIGLAEARAEDKGLLDRLLDVMAANDADFTLTFYHLSQLAAGDNAADQPLRELFLSSGPIDSWLLAWRDRLQQESRSDNERQQAMRAVNPVIIPRNHQVEAAIRAAEDNNDFAPFHALNKVLQSPFEASEDNRPYREPPRDHEVVAQTFCGT